MSSPRSERKDPPLLRGFTTGACAAAAVKGALLMLRDQRWFDAVEVALPAGFTHRFELHGQSWNEWSARCHVVKDAGDDPDITHGVEVHAEVRLTPPPFGHPPLDKGGMGEVTIEGGVGIGRVTKPGLAVPVGEWAINPVPRQMITEAAREVFAPHASSAFADKAASADKPLTPHVVISIPDGEERARRTLNERLGILGGLSILGTSGVVEPISHRAWTDTLEVALDVALAAGAETVVLSTGRNSERLAEQELRLPREVFVMMGDHVGYALQACHRKGIPRVVLAVQFAKLVKVASGHHQTHVRSSRLDLSRLAGWARAIGLDGRTAKKIECANTAREVWETLGPANALVGEVAARALEHLGQWAPGAEITILLADYQGGIAGRFGRVPGLISKDKGP